ncbi:MAG: FMN-binding protein [Candidatus Krumholzibacteria bacterium]|nr:FMN-binding protein [Candidatus Krumholzibacteria bacterium]
MLRRTLFVAGLLLGVSINLGGPARTEVFHSRESALRLAFPGADSVGKQEMFLSSEEAAEAEKLARVELPSRLVTMYVGYKDGDVLGYAFIETHPVRSLPETILIVIDPDGRTRGVHMLAFHEPPEYAPSVRWLEQFRETPLTDELSLRGDVAAITGATLTATAITAAVRRTLAVFWVEVGPEVLEPGPPAESEKTERENPPR